MAIVNTQPSGFLIGALNSQCKHCIPLPQAAQLEVFLSPILDPQCHPTLQQWVTSAGKGKGRLKGKSWKKEMTQSLRKRKARGSG
jgi:hypothetical protein